jgi:hypothetical protein
VPVLGRVVATSPGIVQSEPEEQRCRPDLPADVGCGAECFTDGMERVHAGPHRGAAPAPTGRRAARNRALRRDGTVLVAVCLVLAVLWPFRLVDNPDRPLALELTANMDAIFFEVRDGGDLPAEATEVAPGIQGARVQVGQRDRWVLTGQAGIDCYSLWWDADGVRRGRTLPQTVTCEPVTTATSTRPEHLDRSTSAERDPQAAFEWGPVLPDAQLFRGWFLPLVLVGGGIALAALVRISIALLTDNAPSAVRR